MNLAATGGIARSLHLKLIFIERLFGRQVFDNIVEDYLQLISDTSLNTEKFYSIFVSRENIPPTHIHHYIKAQIFSLFLAYIHVYNLEQAYDKFYNSLQQNRVIEQEFGDFALLLDKIRMTINLLKNWETLKNKARRTIQQPSDDIIMPQMQYEDEINNDQETPRPIDTLTAVQQIAKEYVGDITEKVHMDKDPIEFYTRPDLSNKTRYIASLLKKKQYYIAMNSLNWDELRQQNQFLLKIIAKKLTDRGIKRPYENLKIQVDDDLSK
jgi:hypothetical protein